MLGAMPSGGKRKGAGRPKKKDARVTLSVRVLPVTRLWFEQQAELTGESIGEVLDDLAGFGDGVPWIGKLYGMGPRRLPKEPKR